MKILNPQSATLTNAELYAHLTSKRGFSLSSSSSSSSSSGVAPRRGFSKAPAYEAVTREILEYLSPGTIISSSSTTNNTGGTSTATATATAAAAGEGSKVKVDRSFPLPAYAAVCSSDKVQGLVRELAPFQLAKAEVLGIANLGPKDVAGLDALVEEVDERFTAEEQERILRVVDGWLRRR